MRVALISQEISEPEASSRGLVSSANFVHKMSFQDFGMREGGQELLEACNIAQQVI
jgi:hypothetical protein